MDLSKKILSDIIVFQKYAKFDKEKQRRETWQEIVNRNKQMHIEKFPELEYAIEQAYKIVLNKRALPSMRSIQFAGKPIKINPSRMFNCSYLAIDDFRCFNESMFLLLSGCGVGYSVQKHHVDKLPRIIKPLENRKRRYVVGDSIEGWADAVKALMKSYFGLTNSNIEFDFSDIRPKGTQLITSGGKAPGPQPLKECLVKIRGILDSKINGEKLKPIEVHSIMCHIADAVLAGGIRRAAMVALFSYDDVDMLTCKSGNWWELNPHFGRANNSVVLVRSRVTKDDFDQLWERIKASGAGEPGIFWTNNPEIGMNPCFTGDTIVAVADGRNGVTIKQLAEECKEFNVYSARKSFYSNQNGKSDKFYNWKEEIKKAIAFKTGNKKVITLILSDGSTIKCTEDHLLAINNGEYIKAIDSKGVELVKFFTHFSEENKSYRMINSYSNGYNRQYTFSEKIFVVDIIDNDEYEDVYDLNVEDNHNFYIITKTDDKNYLNCSGVLVHNCGEISLKSNQFCNLTTVNASNIESEEDLKLRVWAATFIGTLQASYTDFHYLRDCWKTNTEKDSLLGVSMTGISSMEVFKYDLKEISNYAKKVNEDVAKLIGINKAARVTCVKPEGTSSLVLGTSSGIHAWHSKYYKRRIRINKNEPIHTYLAIYHPELLEEDYFRPNETSVLTVPQMAPESAITREESALDLLTRVKEVTETWINGGYRTGYNQNNVSCTVSIKDNEWEEVKNWMWNNKEIYSGLSVLPFDGHTYIQPPYEECTEEEYNSMIEKLKDIDLTKVVEFVDITDLKGELACSGGACEVK